MNRRKLSVRVITYNQERYIGQCLQSLVDQNGSFDFEVVVGDDCSTDGTKAVVQEFVESYPGIVRAIFQEKNTGGLRNRVSILISNRSHHSRRLSVPAHFGILRDALI